MFKKIIVFIVLTSTLLPYFDFQRDFGLLEWKSSEALVNIYYDNLQEDMVFSNNPNIRVLSDYDYGIDIERISFYLHNNRLYKIEIVYNPEFADLAFVEERVSSLKFQYGIYSTKHIDEKIGFLNRRGRELKWARGSTLISLSGIDFFDEDGSLVDSQLIEKHEYYPISSQLR